MLFGKKSGKAGGEMSFLEHLEELRWHLVRSAIAICVLAVVAFFEKEFIFDSIILAPKSPDFATYRFLCWLGHLLNMGDSLCISKIPFTLINIDMSGQFSTHMWVSAMAGLVVGFPYIIWELWRFIKPGLTENERKYTHGVVFFTSLLFLLGILFGYYMIAPMSINFLGSYQVSADVPNQIGLNSYISTVTTLTFSTGLVFELPIVIFFLTKIGIVSPVFLRTYRRHAIVIILIIAAIITPPDVASQLLVTFPLVLLYEISIFISVVVYNKKVVGK